MILLSRNAGPIQIWPFPETIVSRKGRKDLNKPAKSAKED